MSVFKKSVRWTTVMTCAAALGLTALAGCMSGEKPPMSATDKEKLMMDAPGDIIQTATGPNMEDVTTLVTAINAAGLAEALEGPGPFTVFAPTNEAFKALPPGKLDELLLPQNRNKLKDILLYHVHSGGAILAKEAKTMSLKTMEGADLHITVLGSDVMVNDAKVVKPDIICKNGVIHWINVVLMPPTAPMPTTMPGGM